MQGKDEKIPGIMDKYVDNSPRSSNVDSLIEKLRIEITKESEDDFINSRRLTVQSTSNRHDVHNEASHDIDKEITDLENLIKRLQAEIVEMTESASKPLKEYFPGNSDEDLRISSSTKDVSNKHVSPIIRNEEDNPKNDFKIRKGGNGHIFPVIIKDNDLFEDTSNIFDEPMSNSRDSFGKADGKALDDVRRNFSMLWNDAPLPDSSNLDLPIAAISNKQKKVTSDVTLKQSLHTEDHEFVSNITKESNIKITTIDESSGIPNTCNKENPEGNVNEINNDDIRENSNSGVPVNSSSKASNNFRSKNSTMRMNICNSKNLISKIVKDSSNNTPLFNNNFPKVTAKDKPISDNNTEIVKKEVAETIQNVNTLAATQEIPNNDSSGSAKAENPKTSNSNDLNTPNVIPAAINETAGTILTDTSQTSMKDVSKESKSYPKNNSTSSIMNSVGKTLRKIVGKDSARSIGKDTKNRDTSTTDNRDDFKTVIKDSSPIDQKNIAIAINPDPPKTADKGVSQIIENDNSKTLVTETSSVDSDISHNEQIIHTVNTMIPKIVSKEDLKNVNVDAAKTGNNMGPETINKDLTKQVNNDIQQNQSPIEKNIEIDNTQQTIANEDIPQDISGNITEIANVSSITSTIPPAFKNDLTEELKSEIMKDAAVSSSLATANDDDIVTEDFATVVIEEDLKSEVEDEDFLSEIEDYPTDNDEDTENKEDPDDDDPNPYDVD